MSTDSQDFDPYEVVLADLRAKRDQLDQAIAAIERARGHGSAAGTASGPAPPKSVVSGVDDPGAFLGMTITDAAKKLLAARRKQMNNPEIAVAFKAGGLHLNSKDPVNTIGAVLTRRANDVGDIVKVARGTWGLKEWYPNRSFKKKASDNDNGEKGDSDTSE